MYPLYSAIIACFINLIITPVIIVVAHRNKWFDRPDERKIHKGNVPRLGGIGFFWSSFLVIMVSTAWSWISSGKIDWPFLAVAGGMLAVHILSLADDFLSLNARFRFLVEGLVAATLCWFGLRFGSLWFPWYGTWLMPVWLSWAVTIVWIVGVINAMNMIDGMDGLCGGIAIIAACSYGVLFLIRGEIMPALYAFALVGSLAGFLFYNFPPARIFMGDSGSTYLGFMLAVLPLLDRNQGKADVALFLGATIALVPIFDTFAAIWRRKKAGTSVMAPDQWHIHHKLLKMGLGNRSILAIVYTACMGMGMTAISSEYWPRRIFVPVTWGVWALMAGLFFTLHFIKEKSLSKAQGEKVPTPPESISLHKN